MPFTIMPTFMPTRQKANTCHLQGQGSSLLVSLQCLAACATGQLLKMGLCGKWPNVEVESRDLSLHPRPISPRLLGKLAPEYAAETAARMKCNTERAEFCRLVFLAKMHRTKRSDPNASGKEPQRPAFVLQRLQDQGPQSCFDVFPFAGKGCRHNFCLRCLRPGLLQNAVKLAYCANQGPAR